MERVPEVTPDLPPTSWRLTLSALRRLPQGLLSRGFGWVADLSIPERLRGPVVRKFAQTVGADLTEAERPASDYGSINEFFVRRLRPGIRSWPRDPEAITSPVDGVIGRFGSITQGRAVQAKGRDYSIAELLGDEKAARPFLDGHFITIYLSPRHYHRIHTPVAGTIHAAEYVPGGLLPVNPPAVTHVADLFVRNERLICHLNSHAGAIAVVAVGAYNVGRISAAFDPAWSGEGRRRWVTNRSDPPPRSRRYDPPIDVAIGEEIMAFHLGSTIVMLLERSVEVRGDLAPGREVQVGETIAFATKEMPTPTVADPKG